jgi:hypothetical protein
LVADVPTTLVKNKKLLHTPVVVFSSFLAGRMTDVRPPGRCGDNAAAAEVIEKGEE